MFFMAYSPQPTVTVDTNYRSADARLIRRKAGGSYAAGPVPLFSLCTDAVVASEMTPFANERARQQSHADLYHNKAITRPADQRDKILSIW
jgi:hypothetical protein